MRLSGSDTISAGPERASNLVDLFLRRADRSEGTTTSYLFPGRDASPIELTAARLLEQAVAVAGSLQPRHRRGDRVILLLPPGPAFLLGFAGTVLAGLVPVPTATPGRARLARSLPGVRRVAADCDAAAVLTTASLSSALAELDSGLDGLLRHELEQLLPGGVAGWVDPELTPQDTAFLQYTSGSTSDPRGVVVTHGALLANLAAISGAFQLSHATRLVTWLPPHHDMGLVGGLLTPLHAGYEAVVLSPNDFVQAPARWLRAISDHRATLSGGPDFAYRLCVERIRDDQLDGIDLSCWRTAFTGAEPVSATTIDTFVERFAPVGFSRDAFYPCYGLAESTLMVTGGTAFVGPTVRSVSRGRLQEEGRAEPPLDDQDDRRLVSCGRPVGDGTEVVVVDPATATELPLGTVGEIWVSGPSVAAGYIGRPAETTAAFHAHLTDGRGPFLRTGDLGVVIDGELHVTGRLKDVIIVQGRTLDAHDVESAVRAVVPMHPQAMTAALSTIDGGERFVIAHEIGRRESSPERLVLAVQAAVAERFEVRADDVVLLRLGALPRTTSGKLRRAEAARLLAAGALPRAGSTSGSDRGT